jgi:hypothetical protein
MCALYVSKFRERISIISLAVYAAFGDHRLYYTYNLLADGLLYLL